jgi:integrase
MRGPLTRPIDTARARGREPGPFAVAAPREAGRGHATSRRDASVDDCRREWAERWYATTAGLRPTTRRDYRKLLDLEILPTFAAAPLASIDALAVREWLATLAAGGLGPKRVGKARAVLSQILASAVEGGKLSRNVAAGVKPPKVQRAEMCFLDADQVEALAEAIDPRWATLIRFGAYSGLRPSELTALKAAASICYAPPSAWSRRRPRSTGTSIGAG